jgi:diguanylate cyclase (GGDEF)-like protein/PAS domain S-box-containing protein
LSNQTGLRPPPSVLVADDDAGLRLIIRAALEQDGWAVEEAPDGASALASVERLQPDIVLLDVSMPGIDGFETCARLRALRDGEFIPVLMITSMDDQPSIGRAFEVGATDFLSKPFNFTVLRQRLQYMHRARQASRELRNERDFVSAVVDTAGALVLILDPTGRIKRFNPSCERASGFSASEALDERVWELLCSPEARDGERVRFERLVSERLTTHYEGAWTTRRGARRQIDWSNSVLLDGDGQVVHVVCTGLDATERHQAEEKALFLESYDQLTGLPNRQLLTARLQEAVWAADADRLQVAVLFLGLDRFNDVNAWGHAAGDTLLQEAAERLTAGLRLGDVLARQHPGLRAEMARAGGDEFTALVTGVPDANEVAAIARRLQQTLSRPFTLEGHEFTMSASVGAALYPGDGSDAESLLGNAESAMRAARTEQRGSFQFFSAAMHTRVATRLSLETDLRQAVERGELVLLYQPKNVTRTRRIAGAEALVRWQHPSRGLLPPAAFIGLAEETGLIVPLGEWVLREACLQVRRWREAGLQLVPVAVNLSSAQFQVDDLLERIEAIVSETAMDTNYLAVEITETMIMRHPRRAHDTLSRLDDLGVQVAIDDFGTGYSALAALKDLPIHQLKIDRAFVKDLAESQRDRAITRAIIAMAHSLGLTVVGEGVESEEQLAILRAEECDEIQGFLISRPVPADQFATLLRPSEGDAAGAPGDTVNLAVGA